MGDLVIFGAGDLARLVRTYFDSDSDYRVVAFCVDGDSEAVFEGLPLVPFEKLLETYPPASVDMFVAIGYRQVNRGRADVYTRLRKHGYNLATYVSSRAIVSTSASLGDNCFVFEGVIVQPFVEIGPDTIIWSGAVIAHDTRVGAHCFVAPCASVSGNVRIGNYCFVGNNATVRDGVELGQATVVGAGALAKWDTPSGTILRAEGTQPLAGRTSGELDRL